MSNQATINRIKALLAKTEWRGCIENEARLAWEKARELSNKHKIRLDDLGIASPVSDTPQYPTAGQYSATPDYHDYYSASPKAQRATANSQPMDAEPSGWAKTFLLVLFAASGALTYFALQYGPADNQAARIALWLGFLLCALFTIAIFVDLTRSYQLNLLTLPSTWLMSLASILAIIFLFSHGVVDDGEAFGSLFRNLTDGHMLLLAGLVVATISALITNIIKSNLLFGLLLSSVQLALVVLMLAMAVAIVIIASGRCVRSTDS
jgi:hypothetical protein